MENCFSIGVEYAGVNKKYFAIVGLWLSFLIKLASNFREVVDDFADLCFFVHKINYDK